MENITKAIISVMSEVKNIGKNTTVGTGTNSYKAVSDADVKKAIRESMEKNGLSIVCTGVTSRMKLDRWEEVDTWAKVKEGEEKPMKTKQSIFTEVDTTYLLMHTSGESQVLAGYGQGVDTQDKGAGKATTYALKNTLINTFLVPTGEDTDNTHSDDIAVPQKKYGDKVKPNWYNDLSKHKATYITKIQAGELTPESIIKGLEEKGYKLGGPTREEIMNLK